MDIAELKKEIENRKKNIDERGNVLGEQKVKKQSGGQFLRELMHSARTGQETHASKKVKAVDRLAESKVTGKPVDPDVLDHLAKPSNAPSLSSKVESNTPPQRTASMDAREEARTLKEDNYGVTQKNNAGLSDLISQYQNTPRVGAPMNSNGMLTEEQMLAKMRGNNGNPANYNNYGYGSTGIINEEVTRVAKELLNENFGKLYAEAMKNSIIETYKREVIKEAINENRSFIEQIVRETIIDLQKKAQSKK